MRISGRRTIHPNIVKHIAELKGEKYLEPKVLDELTKLNFYKEKNGMIALEKFLQDRVSPEISKKLQIEVNSYLYEKDAMTIVIDYIDYSSVRRAIRSDINKFNNNKNYTYDFEAIISDFKRVCRKGSNVQAYDLESNNLGGYLFNSYKFYAKGNSKFIEGILNDKGSLVETEDGILSLEDVQSIKEEKVESYIDFSSCVRNICVASQDLYEVDNNVIYDLFSLYLSEQTDKIAGVIQDKFKVCYGNTMYSPIVSIHKPQVGNITYRVNAIKRGNLYVNLVRDTLSYGVTFNSLQKLYSTISNKESEVYGPNNDIPNYFKQSRTNSGKKSTSNKKFNDTKFLDLIRGVVSLNELTKYLRQNNINLYTEDVIIFRDLAYYKRFSSINDYLLLRDVTPELIKQSENLVDEIPYDNNDMSYNNLITISNGSFSTLKDYIRSSLSRTKPVRVFDLLESIKVDFGKVAKLYKISVAMYNACKKFMTSEQEIFDYLNLKGSYNSDEERNRCLLTNKAIADTFSSDSDKYYKEDFLEERDFRIVLRYYNLWLILLQHLYRLLSACNIEIDEAILRINNDSLFLPEKLDLNKDDIIKFKSEVPFNFFDENVTENFMTHRKQYSIFYASLMERYANCVSVIRNWQVKLNDRAKQINLITEELTISEALHCQAFIAASRPKNVSAELESFLESSIVVDGVVFRNGEPYNHKGFGYVHENGYYIQDKINSGIYAIPSNEKFF